MEASGEVIDGMVKACETMETILCGLSSFVLIHNNF